MPRNEGATGTGGWWKSIDGAEAHRLEEQQAAIAHIHVRVVGWAPGECAVAVDLLQPDGPLTEQAANDRAELFLRLSEYLQREIPNALEVLGRA